MEDIEIRIERARALLQMKRAAEALQELMLVLETNPDNYTALILACAGCHELKDSIRTLEYAQKLVAAYPADDVAHYYMAIASDMNKNSRSAEAHIREAIAINPHDADYFGFLAALYIEKSDWERALDFANQGLEIDPENILCLNHRTYALTKLDRYDEVKTAVEDTLAASPDSWYSHSNVGWSKLETRDYNGAKSHFAEALRLNPNAEPARRGMLETLKASNFIYAWYLRYYFWLSKFSNQAQWFIIIAFVVGRRVIFGLAKKMPALYVIGFTMLLLVYTSWIIEPLGNFILMLDRFGRYVLKQHEKIAAVTVGTGFIGGLLLLGIGYFTDFFPLLVIGGVWATVIVPLGKFFHEEPETRSVFIKAYTALITLLAVSTIATMFIDSWFDTTLSAYTISVVAYTWIYNIRQSS